MKLSVIIPAYNEAKLITECIRSIQTALQSVSRPALSSEIIVVDNNSTDRTGALAKDLGATVVFEPVNQIARARNAGAGHADGDWYIFVDADSRPDAGLIGDVLRAIEGGEVIGGGSTVRMEGIPLAGCVFVNFWNGLSLLFRWAAGAFIFCEAAAFHAVGGFNEDFFASEEIDFSKRLKRHGHARGQRPQARARGFTILHRHPLRTSGRKMHLYSFAEIGGLMLRYLCSPRRTVRDPRRLKLWYDGRR
jgi:glycosyltransferase involved in cell wall biosynthesis